MIKYWKSAVFKNYLNFGGTATRSEFWYYQLTNFLIIMFIVLLFIMPSLIMLVTPFEFWAGEGFSKYAYYNTWGAGGLYLLFFLGTLIPSLAIFFRRIQDVGKSGGKALLMYFIPIFGPIYVFYLLVLKGEGNTSDTAAEGTQKQTVATAANTTSSATVVANKPAGVYYEVRLSNVSSVPVGVTFKVAMTVTAKKFVVDSKTGKEKEEVINDEIQIGMMKAGKEIYLKSYRFTKTVTALSLTLDQKPDKIGIDPYNKLPERA